MNSNEPTFEEGPFFLAVGTTFDQLGKNAIITSTRVLRYLFEEV